MILLMLAKYLIVFGVGLLGLVNGVSTLRRGWSQWRGESKHRFDLRTFFMADPRDWHHWPASHWLTAGSLVFLVSLGLVAIGLLG